MKLYVVFPVVFATLTSSVSAQTNKAESSLPAVPGWRLPTQSDMKAQWSEKTWDAECRKYEEADKKAKEDAIENQKQHHAKQDFQDEFRGLLKRYRVEYDERYVWD